ncbi:hypothetical protein ES703_14936 [subsurface metagenome]
MFNCLRTLDTLNNWKNYKLVVSTVLNYLKKEHSEIEYSSLATVRASIKRIQKYLEKTNSKTRIEIEHHGRAGARFRFNTNEIPSFREIIKP